MHGSGRAYEWEVNYSPDERPFSPLPEKLRTLLQGQPEKQQRLSPAIGETIPKGGRNNALTSLAGTMRRRGMGLEAIEAALLAENLRACNPPLPEAEVRAIAASVGRYAPGAPGADEQPAAAQNFRLDDIGNAERFVAQHGQRVRYVHKWGRWLIYDGRHWAADDNGLIEQLATQTTRSIYEEAAAAAQAGNEQRAADLSKWARASANLSRRRAMLETAKSDPAVAIRFTELDKSPMLLNVQNGVINLETMELLPHDPALLITHCLPVVYDPVATCPRWERFLARILPDEATRHFVQKAVGYSLSGLIVEQCLFFLYGLGANGKSTLLTILSDLLSGLAARIRAEPLLLKDRDAIPNDIAALTGARLVVTSELTGTRSLNESMVKDLTGDDSITARFLHQEFFTFTPIFKIWMYGNHKPGIRGTDDGIWRRIRLIPFTVQIPESERDGALLDKLRAELPGILTWSLAGWRAYQKDGLQASAAVSQATDAYREQSDALGQFLADCCLVQEGAICQSKLLHDAYGKWGGALTAVKFAQVMQERGFVKDKATDGPSKGRIVWQGIGLLADGDG